MPRSNESRASGNFELVTRVNIDGQSVAREEEDQRRDAETQRFLKGRELGETRGVVWFHLVADFALERSCFMNSRILSREPGLRCSDQAS